jgi:arginine decarboxylase
MEIRVSAATATGSTALAAFDRALQQVGVHDLNLIPLSSVVPAGASVVRATCDPTEFRIGDRLSCVMASERVVEPGSEAWAGLGWALSTGGGGLFVEAHGRSQRQVEFELAATLEQLTLDRTRVGWSKPEFEVAGIAFEHDPVCALAIAVFETMPWSSCGPEGRTRG